MASTNTSSRRSFLIAATAALALGATTAGAYAQATPYYAGKTVEIIVPYAPGGSNDITARFLAPLLSKHIAGNPKVQVITMPGGETIVGANEFQRRPHDGLTWLVAGASTTFQDFLGNDAAEFKMSDWLPLIGFPQGQVVYGSKSLGIKDAHDLGKTTEPLILAAQGTDGSSILRILSLDLLGVKYQLIPGYAGTGDKRTAILQGEITVNGEGTVGYNSNMKAEAEKGNIVPLYSYGFLNAAGELERDPGAPEFPTVAEAYEWINGKKIDGDLWEVYKALVPAQSDLQKSFFLHKDDPQEAIDAVRAGIAEAMTDPEWAKATTTVFEGYPPFTDRLEERLAEITHPKPEQIKVLLDWLAKIGFPRTR